ncbi:PREDICTED: uncharacterized protein LOC109580868 [Amphimedon queenslandica]|uniref:VWFA domain-containing protein n=1 Tax=Amphimedon queenslandica TaxID=400682 RepID=A0AAN0IZV1_AMPQE|nr:PREDICTED: uncharacterized protein LOC109580868 [Amphimedon queenslandica]|eukprot:XP_019849986.1 PREDICTED: uncharacterized protein LOC109580868 [Amphimedon queenslandica]
MISGFSTIAAAVVILLCITEAQGTDCSALASAGNCSFYDCLHTKFNCDAKDYPRRRGKRYCQKYIDESSCFTTAGQAWITSVRTCLMQSIVNSALYSDANTDCGEFEAFAVGSRPQCYTDNGFCTDIFLSPQCQNFNCIQDKIYDDNKSWSRTSLYQCDRPGTSLVSVIQDYLDCTARAFDFIILLDASGSVGSSNFEIMKNFVADMLSNFTIGPDDTRVGVIRFADTPSIVIPLGSNNTYAQLASAIRVKVSAVLTDGLSNNPSATVQSAQAVHNDKITVFSFGIGSDISNAELIAIASDGQQGVFTISGFSSDTFQAVLIQLRVSTCLSSTESETGKEIATTLPKGSSRLLVYVFPSMGMTLKIDITVGNLVVRGSFTVQNPDALTQDFSVMSNGTNINYFISPQLYIQSTTDDDDDDDDGSRRKRQTSMPNVYLSIAGLNDINSFALNTTFGDTTNCSGICKLKLLAMSCEVLRMNGEHVPAPCRN